MLKAVMIEDSDWTPKSKRKHWQAALRRPQCEETLTADIVLYKGRVVKNYHGPIQCPIESPQLLT